MKGIMNSNSLAKLACGLASAGVVVLSGYAAEHGQKCECGEKCTCSPCLCGVDAAGRWALKLPYGSMNTGWLQVKRDGSASLLWRWASPDPAEAKLDGNKVVVRRRSEWPRQDKLENQRFDVLEGEAIGDEMELMHRVVTGDGKDTGVKEQVSARRIPPVGPAPDLKKIVYGAPINLIAKDSLEGWKLMSNDKNGWSVKDGVLSNKVRDAEGKVPKAGANLQTVREDFFDFNLKTEVRLPKDSNSGIYLRGIYEIQMIDSYGKAVDCHNMGALYGRVVPSEAAEKPAGEWQTVDITLYKRHVTVVLNGKKIIDNAPVMGITGGALQPDEFKAGPLYLQGDHADADYRNMVLTPIVK